MAKNSVSDWDTTAANNTDVAGINIAEGCDPGNINDGMRAMMAQLKSQFGTLEIIPPGLVVSFARSTAPTGWLKANGAAVSRTIYASLFSAIGTAFGGGNGSTTFNLPDLRGEFIRGLDDGRGVDVSRALGSAQGGQNAAHTHTGSTSSDSHNHTGTTNTTGEHQHDYNNSDPSNGTTGRIGKGSAIGVSSQSGEIHAAGNHAHSFTTSTDTHNHTFTTASSGGSEVRVRNVALLACIKY